MHYYRSIDTNPNWFDGWLEQFDQTEDAEDIIDQLAELSCGIQNGASDTCQKYAKHVRVHLEAAFKLGMHKANKSIQTDGDEIV